MIYCSIQNTSKYYIMPTNELVCDVIDGECHGIAGATLAGAEGGTPTDTTTNGHRDEVTPEPTNEELLS